MAVDGTNGGEPPIATDAIDNGSDGTPPRPGRRILAIAALIAVVAAVVLVAVRAIDDHGGPSDATSPAPSPTPTAATRPPTTTTTTITTTTTATTTPPLTTLPPTTQPTAAPASDRGAPCNPADGHPDCTNATADGTYRIVDGYAAYVTEFQSTRRVTYAPTSTTTVGPPTPTAADEGAGAPVRPPRRIDQRAPPVW